MMYSVYADFKFVLIFLKTVFKFDLKISSFLQMKVKTLKFSEKGLTCRPSNNLWNGTLKLNRKNLDKAALKLNFC